MSLPPTESAHAKTDHRAPLQIRLPRLLQREYYLKCYLCSHPSSAHCSVSAPEKRLTELVLSIS